MAKKPTIENELQATLGTTTGTQSAAAQNNAAVKTTTAKNTAAKTTAAKTAATTKTTDPVSSAQSAYDLSMQTLKAAQKNQPTYAGTYDSQINDIYQQITGREAFSYDASEDALYQMYKDQYMQNGAQAMKSSMGQAAALTGGYGSSYAQSAGQQTYDSYLSQLNDRAVDMYDRAYSRYQDEGNALNDQLNTMRGLRNDELSAYESDWNRWNADRSYAQSQADTAYSRLQNEREWQATQEATAYQQQQDARSYLIGLASLGYEPTSAELKAAGMTKSQWKALTGGATTSSSNYKKPTDPNTTPEGSDPTTFLGVRGQLEQLKAQNATSAELAVVAKAGIDRINAERKKNGQTPLTDNDEEALLRMAK